MPTLQKFSYRKLHFAIMAALPLVSIGASLLVWINLNPLYMNKTITYMYFICCALITILLPAAYYILFIRGVKLEAAVLTIVTALSLISCVVCPPGMIPDEAAHIQTAYRYSNTIMQLPFDSQNDGIRRRQGDEEICDLPVYPSAADYNDICENMELLADEGEETVIYDSTLTRNNVTGPITYIPSALGITLARLLGLDAYPMLYLGRIFNFLFYSACLYFAIRITPLGKYIFASVAVLPMVIHLACSFSGDMAVMGLAFLYSAYMLRMIYGSDPVSKKDMAICSILIFLIVPCKFIFFFLVLLPLLIPAEKFKSKRSKRLFSLLIFGFALLSIAVQSMPTVLKYISSIEDKESSKINWAYETYSVGWVLDHPLETARCYIETIFRYGKIYICTMLGVSLGHLEIRINMLLIWILAFCVLLAALLGNESNNKIPYQHRIPYVFIFGTAVLLSMMAMLVSWTPLGSPYIEGVQGRYFIPVLPLMLLAFSGVRVRCGDIIRKYILILETLIDVYTLALVFTTIIRR